MDYSGKYDVDAFFDKQLPGDRIVGVLGLEQGDGSESPSGVAGFYGQLAGRRSPVAMGPVSDLRISPAGAISFKIKASRGDWTFTGFISGGTITGRHALARHKKKSAGGRWTATKRSDV